MTLVVVTSNRLRTEPAASIIAIEWSTRSLEQSRGTRDSRRAEMRAAWVAARARNTLRHPVRLAAICGTVFTVALMLLVLAPRDARRASQQIAPLSTHWRDTATLLVAVDTATRRLAVAESTLALVVRWQRGQHTFLRQTRCPPLLAPGVTPSSPRAASSRGFSSESRTLPLPQSYRALGESRSLAGDSRVRAMLDSLADVEREREEFGAGGGVDPIFVALTARATCDRPIDPSDRGSSSEHDSRFARAASTSVGQRAGRCRRRHVRSSATARLVAGAAGLGDRCRSNAARRANVVTDRQLREARAQANVVAPPIAILGASLVLGLTLGFAIALMIEVGRTASVGSAGSGARNWCARSRGRSATGNSARTVTAQGRSSPSTADRPYVRCVSSARVARERLRTRRARSSRSPVTFHPSPRRSPPTSLRCPRTRCGARSS